MKNWVTLLMCIPLFTGCGDDEKGLYPEPPSFSKCDTSSGDVGPGKPFRVTYYEDPANPTYLTLCTKRITSDHFTVGWRRGNTSTSRVMQARQCKHVEGDKMEVSIPAMNLNWPNHHFACIGLTSAERGKLNKWTVQ